MWASAMVWLLSSKENLSVWKEKLELVVELFRELSGLFVPRVVDVAVDDNDGANADPSRWDDDNDDPNRWDDDNDGGGDDNNDDDDDDDDDDEDSPYPRNDDDDDDDDDDIRMNRKFLFLMV